VWLLRRLRINLATRSLPWATGTARNGARLSRRQRSTTRPGHGSSPPEPFRIADHLRDRPGRRFFVPRNFATCSLPWATGTTRNRPGALLPAAIHHQDQKEGKLDRDPVGAAGNRCGTRPARRPREPLAGAWEQSLPDGGPPAGPTGPAIFLPLERKGQKKPKRARQVGNRVGNKYGFF